MATFQYSDEVEPGKIPVIDGDGNQVDFDPEKIIFPEKWEAALEFAKKVAGELKNIDPNKPLPNDDDMFRFIVDLIDRFP